MIAYKCDKCGTLHDGPRPHSGSVLEREISAVSWARKLDKVIVKVRVEPVGDPTGFAGMDLCAPCVNELVRAGAGVSKDGRRGKKK